MTVPFACIETGTTCVEKDTVNEIRVAPSEGDY